MIIKKDHTNLYQIIGRATIEEQDNLTYCGHFTIEGLSRLIDELKKHHKDNEMVAISTTYCDSDSYRLIAIPDDGDGKTGIALQGCAHGPDGSR